MRLAPEGVPFVLGGIAVLFLLGTGARLAGGGAWYVLPAAWLPVTVWIPWFFRNPLRPGPRADTLVIAPADGRVVRVDEVAEGDFVGGRALRICIFMNVFDVHVNRHPVSGRVEYREYRPGKFLNASLDKASEHNERMSLGIGTPRGRVLVRQIAGLVARRIRTDPALGEPVVQGERLGIIRFGSRVDTFLPGAVPRVVEGDRTLAGQTVIAEWPS